MLDWREEYERVCQVRDEVMRNLKEGEEARQREEKLQREYRAEAIREGRTFIGHAPDDPTEAEKKRHRQRLANEDGRAVLAEVYRVSGEGREVLGNLCVDYLAPLRARADEILAGLREMFRRTAPQRAELELIARTASTLRGAQSQQPLARQTRPRDNGRALGEPIDLDVLLALLDGRRDLLYDQGSAPAYPPAAG